MKKNTMLKRWCRNTTAMLLLVSLAGCGAPANQPEATPEATATVAPTEAPTATPTVTPTPAPTETPEQKYWSGNVRRQL